MYKYLGNMAWYLDEVVEPYFGYKSNLLICLSLALLYTMAKNFKYNRRMGFKIEIMYAKQFYINGSYLITHYLITPNSCYIFLATV